MVRYTADHKVHIKILYVGIAESGKSTIIKTLIRIYEGLRKKYAFPPSEGVLYPSRNLDQRPHDEFFRGSVWFDTRLVLRIGNAFFHVYSVSGQRRFSPLRKKIFDGTDGVIFVVDSRVSCFEDNIESLRVLKEMAQERLIREIPLVIMLHKQDLYDVIGEEDFKQVLKDEKLWYDSDHELHSRNPLIFETYVRPNKTQNINRSFLECARQSIKDVDRYLKPRITYSEKQWVIDYILKREELLAKRKIEKFKADYKITDEQIERRRKEIAKIKSVELRLKEREKNQRIRENLKKTAIFWIIFGTMGLIFFLLLCFYDIF
jgi:GTPase SAR1 family protein